MVAETVLPVVTMPVGTGDVKAVGGELAVAAIPGNTGRVCAGGVSAGHCSCQALRKGMTVNGLAIGDAQPVHARFHSQ